MSLNLLRRSRGPAFAHYRGATFFTKDAFNLVPDLKAFGIESDSTPAIDNRYGGRLIKTSMTDIGAWKALSLPVIYPYSLFKKGQFTTPVRTISAVSTVDSTLTVKNHNEITGTGCVVVSTGNVPTGLVANTQYFLVVSGDDGNTLKLATTYDNATAEAPVTIALTGVGSGTIKLIRNTPLIINYLDEDQTQIIFHNAGVTKMPSLSLGATKTAFGAIEFTAYCLHGMDWSDDDSVFTIGTHGDDASQVDETQIPTVPYSVAFGDSEPFDDLQPRDGVTIDFDLKLNDVPDDNEGIATHELGDLTAMIKLLPINLTEADLWGQLLMQGEGAGRGQSLPKGILNIFGPDNNPYIQIPLAQMIDGSLKIGSKEDRIQQISFKSVQAFSAGVALPIFSVGVEAPE